MRTECYGPGSGNDDRARICEGLFSDTVPGARASATLYSLVETAKANGLEPHAYLSTVFARLPHLTTVEEYEALLPWNVRAAHASSSVSVSDRQPVVS